MKLQSAALEYLVTYAWLIIVLGALAAVLFYFIPFAQNVGGRVEPGSCIVDRPYGPGTTQFIKLAGVCDNDLPEYVASIDGSSLLAGSINFTPAITSAGQNSITITLWADTSSFVFQYLVSYVNPDNSLDEPYPSFYSSFFPFCGTYADADPTYGVWLDGETNLNVQCALLPAGLNSGQMDFYAFTYNGVTLTGYTGVNDHIVSNSFQASLGSNVIYPSGELYLGGFFGADFDGYLSNIEVYNTSLSENAVEALYIEGVGGDPIDLSNLVGWWPLNGDDMDYSGDYNNNPSVAASNVITYTNIWTSTYTAP